MIFCKKFAEKRIKMVKYGKVVFVSGYLFAIFWIYAYMRSIFDEREFLRRVFLREFSWIFVNFAWNSYKNSKKYEK